MEEIKQEIQNHKIFDRWKNLENKWNEHLNGIDALLIKNGIDNDEVIKTKTLAFHYWFYKLEFIESISIISKDLLIFASSQERINFLSFMQNVSSSHSKKVMFIPISNPVKEDEIKQIIQILQKENLKKLGVFEKEVQFGDLIIKFEELLKKNNFEELSATQNIQQILSVKDDKDQEIIKISSEITDFYFKEFLDKVEVYLDDGSQIKHSEISRKMEEKLEKTKFSLKKKFGVLYQFVDFSFTPVVQSGGVYDLKPNRQSNDDYLKDDVVILNLSAKYFEMNCHVCRTLLINPTESVGNNYQALLFLQKQVISSLQVGQKLCDVFLSVKNNFVKNYPNLEKNLPSNFGFGTGYQFKEVILVISIKNQHVIEEGNVFCVSTYLKDLQREDGLKYSMQLTDTIFVKQNKNLNLTNHQSSDYGNIAYDMSGGNQEEYQEPVKPKINLQQGRVSRAQKRREQTLKEQQKNQRIQENQRILMQQKNEDLKQRIMSGTLKKNQDKTLKIDLMKINAYQNKSLPKYDSNKIHIDNDNNTVLVPINGKMFPIHIACLKNVTKHVDKKFSALRFNLQTPMSFQGNIDFPLQSQLGTNPIYIKELTYKSTDADSIQFVLKQIKELQKNYKVSQTLNQKFLKQQERENLSEKIKVLNNTKIRPTLQGRKSEGQLIAYKNGFKFVTKNQKQFILMNSNIKKAFFQPCGDDMIVLIHFLLNNPVVIKNKPTEHIQFYTDIGQGIEDLSDRKLTRRGMDEQDEDQLEQEARDYHNKMYLQFVKYVEQNWDSNTKFDSPFSKLGFFGSPNQNNVFIMPTAYCLVSLIEKPFLVIMLDEIELVSIERIDNKIKSFDMIIIFKDYSKQVKELNNIPKENLDSIKEWLNSQDILFIEGGTINVKWDKFLKMILEDPQKFLDDGAWSGFMDQSDEEEDEIEEEEDSDFDQEDISDDEDEDDDDFEDELDEENSDEDEYEDDEYDDDISDEEEDDESHKNKRRK